MAHSIYDLEVKNIEGQNISMAKYKGKTLLIVNVASKCGFTSQYKELEEIYREYNGQGLEILAFPCNQFGSQELNYQQDAMKLQLLIRFSSIKFFGEFIFK